MERQEGPIDKLAREWESTYRSGDPRAFANWIALHEPLILGALKLLAEINTTSAAQDAVRYQHLRARCQYGFEDREGPQLIHRNGETGPCENASWREDLDAAIDAEICPSGNSITEPK